MHYAIPNPQTGGWKVGISDGPEEWHELAESMPPLNAMAMAGWLNGGPYPPHVVEGFQWPKEMTGERAPKAPGEVLQFPHHVHGEVEETVVFSHLSDEENSDRIYTLYGMLEFWKCCNNMGIHSDFVDRVFPGEAPAIRRHLNHALVECRHELHKFMGRLDQQKQLQLLVFIYDTYDSGGTPEKLREALESEGITF